jgi:hypothetical protein
MIRYTRGSKVVISTVFKDTSGDVAFPTSVHLTIAYPENSTGNPWPLSGTDLQTTASISMTTPSTDPASSASAIYGVWKTTWNSGASGPGIVYWTAVPTTELLVSGVNEGRFELRGGLASSRAVASTLG